MSGLAAPSQRRQVTGAKSAAPGHADQEAKAERDRDGGEWTLYDRVLQRLFEGGGDVLRRVKHRAAALGSVVDRGIHIGAGLLVALARLLLRGAGEGVEGVGDLVGQGGD